MQPPRHPQTHLAALAILLLGVAAGCCGDADDSAAADGGDGVDPETVDEASFIEAHADALCSREETILLDGPVVEEEPYEYVVGDDCQPLIEAHYRDVTSGQFVPEIAAGCHEAYVDLDAPAPFGDLDWRWCFFSWVP
jgi:hypothetical protein